jgi:hypothetical protein
MRWLNIRKAKIDPDLRKTFEQYGIMTMQTLVGTNATFFRHKGSLTTVQMVEQPLLAWLTEQYDRTDRKETWSLTMEVAITIFVLGELIFDFANWQCR